MNIKLKSIVEYLSKAEQVGVVFFDRCSNEDMLVWVRDPRLYGQSVNEHWPQAGIIEEGIRVRGGTVTSIQFDPHSGTIVLRVYRIYSNGEKK